MTFTNLKYVKDEGGNNISIKFTCDGQTEMSVPTIFKHDVLECYTNTGYCTSFVDVS